MIRWRPFSRLPRPLQRHAFSLIELLVALGIFAIVLGILFSTINQVQRLWGIQRTRLEIYENARLVFDLISRDVQGVVTNQQPGARVMFSPTVTGEADTILAMVSQSGIGVHPTDDSPLAEVAYRLVVTSFTDSDGNVHIDTDLYRCLTTSHDPATNLPDPRLNFYHQIPDVWALTSSLRDSELVCRQIDTMMIRCFDRDGNQLTTATDSPLARVDVEITLSEASPTAQAATYRRSVRTFTKRILTFRGQ